MKPTKCMGCGEKFTPKRRVYKFCKPCMDTFNQEMDKLLQKATGKDTPTCHSKAKNTTSKE